MSHDKWQIKNMLANRNIYNLSVTSICMKFTKLHPVFKPYFRAAIGDSSSLQGKRLCTNETEAARRGSHCLTSENE